MEGLIATSSSRSLGNLQVDYAEQREQKSRYLASEYDLPEDEIAEALAVLKARGEVDGYQTVPQVLNRLDNKIKKARSLAAEIRAKLADEDWMSRKISEMKAEAELMMACAPVGFNLGGDEGGMQRTGRGLDDER